jgi:hypothetical protein
LGFRAFLDGFHFLGKAVFAVIAVPARSADSGEGLFLAGDELVEPIELGG